MGIREKLRELRNSRAASGLARKMRLDWDERARDNARHFVATSREEWSDGDFFESGRIWIRYYITPEIELLSAGRKPSELRVLEIGSGAGRMTLGLSEIFGWVEAVDVSPEMVAQARRSVADRPNVRVSVNNGMDLAQFPDADFDLAFSAIVFQHIPSKAIIRNYIQETYRVLRPGGFFKFQAQGCSIPLEDANTWVGVGFTEGEMTAAAKAAGFRIQSMTGAGDQDFWITLQKPLL